MKRTYKIKLKNGSWLKLEKDIFNHQVIGYKISWTPDRREGTRFRSKVEALNVLTLNPKILSAFKEIVRIH